ncbi:MlaD family protein [Stappia sp. ES.058]|uniref:MlaD family protein n=1 Tax=Stappia sp. ES.058 TaxID=1881061 RepID=UPI00087B2588|nr:MlaD family protein [Stappia sp. ES.058]SDU25205.1 phospholipid/cholesterol/gamma-HCH transport system substrate-binding protein [Stappia sp. ES.058]
METRANYVAIGAFVFVTMFIGFAFIYWLGSRSEGPRALPVKVIFNGAVTGLSVGGAVNFNGIKVGDVGSLGFDPKDPSVVIATIRVNPTTPLRADVKATLGFQTLSGIAYVELSGGSPTSPLLLDADAEEPPVIHAERSAFEDIVEGARDILSRADTTLAAVERVVEDNRDDISDIISNARVFSEALAKNADGVDTFMSSVASTGEALQQLSGRLEGLVDSATAVVQAVPPEKVTEIVDNTAAITSKAADAADGLTSVLKDAEKAASDLATFTVGLNESLSEFDKVIGAVRPEAISEVVDNVAAFSKVLQDRSDDIDRLVVSSSKTMENIEQVTAIAVDREADIRAVIADARVISDKLIGTVEQVNGILTAVDPARVESVLASVDNVATGLSGRTDTITRAIDQAGVAVDNVTEFSDSLKGRGPDIDAILADAKTLTATLNATGTRVQSVVAKVEAMVDADGEGLITEATKAASAIRKVADTLAERVGPITSGLEKFTVRGSADFSAAMAQLNRTLLEIQRAASELNRNPQRVIFGGSDTPTFGGAQRR